MKNFKFTVYTALIFSLICGSLLTHAASADTRKQEQIGELVTLNFRESSIQEVFDILSRKDKVNIILGKGVTGTVSVNLYNISVKEAIYRVAESAGYAVEFRNGDYVILDHKDAGQDHSGGLTQLKTFKVQYSDPKQVADILTKYLSRYGKVTPLIDRRMIVIEDTPEFLERANKLLQELDAQPKQILIEAKVLEVTLDDGEIYGVDWNRVFGATTVGTNGLASGTATGGPRQAGFFFGLAGKNLELFLEAQATKNRVKTLSTPKLLAMENQEARVSIGDSTGFKVTTTINQVTTESIQFLESGVILRVTPSVDQQGRVLLKVHPEVSSASLSAGIPSKKSTEVTTELLSEDGQAIFIGGLIKKISRKDKTGVPILGDIPGIGRLFSTTTESVNNTETVIIITPKVIQNPSAIAEFTDDKNQLIEHNGALIMDHQLKLESSEFKDKLDTSVPL
ncbi:type II secretion system protein GspD [Methylotenera sp.]|uniref:type II secretion system protein GspD n=1 Tax=Methylotenera sp. TaxID=2051956 RepID=UPI002489AEE6|nr:secretin N-terminal domain-containing protein [Methylotenera sp.]MDI1298371.1 secretin N-terminal domain-containing protein [Methylotenera sp.]